jgi:FkbM family methyltransferase
VYSVEPIPLTFEILSNGVRKLSLNNVRLFNCGISDKDGSGIMEIPTYESGGENFYQARIIKEKKSDPSFRDCAVVLKSLDSLSSTKKNVCFIKIDVEGHELEVIKGAKQLIERFMPPMLIEISGNPDEINTSASRLFGLLNEKGYSPYWYDGAKLNKRNHGDKSVNYFFLTNDQFRDIQARMIA